MARGVQGLRDPQLLQLLFLLTIHNSVMPGKSKASSMIAESGLHVCFDRLDAALVDLLTKDLLKEQLSKLNLCILNHDRTKIEALKEIVTASWGTVEQHVMLFKTPNHKWIGDPIILNPKQDLGVQIFLKTLTGETISKNIKHNDTVDFAEYHDHVKIFVKTLTGETIALDIKPNGTINIRDYVQDEEAPPDDAFARRLNAENMT